MPGLRRADAAALHCQAKDVSKMFSALTSTIRAFEAERFSMWDPAAVGEAQHKLRQPLLVREEETGRVSVNFDAELVELLREVKYLSQLGKELPEVRRSAPLCVGRCRCTAQPRGHAASSRSRRLIAGTRSAGIHLLPRASVGG